MTIVSFHAISNFHTQSFYTTQLNHSYLIPYLKKNFLTSLNFLLSHAMVVSKFFNKFELSLISQDSCNGW